MHIITVSKQILLYYKAVFIKIQQKNLKKFNKKKLINLHKLTKKYSNKKSVLY